MSRTPAEAIAHRWAYRRAYDRAYECRRRAEKRDYITAYKKTHPCIDCGESDPVVLDFDHRDPSNKSENGSSLVSGNRKIALIDLEISRCDVRCANCHRRKHHRERTAEL